jgi:hypothetical protein
MKSIHWLTQGKPGKCLIAALIFCFACAAASAKALVPTQTAKAKTTITKISKTGSTLPLGGDVMVQVKGVAIPFTSFGVVHRLETVPGVTSVQFNLKHGVAILRLAPNAYVTNDMLCAAVKNASYTPGSIVWISAKVQEEHEAARGAAKNNEIMVVPAK